jgi:hypothetical protein
MTASMPDNVFRRWIAGAAVPPYIVKVSTQDILTGVEELLLTAVTYLADDGLTRSM